MESERERERDRGGLIKTLTALHRGVYCTSDYCCVCMGVCVCVCVFFVWVRE